MIVSSGGGSFITYPLLLAVGLPGIVANATSSVGLFSSWTTSIYSFRNEIAINRKVIRFLLIPGLLGALTGSWLLTKTPENVFGYLAPLLIFLGSIALLYRNTIVVWGNHVRISTERRRVAAVGVLTFLISAYSSFFGAGVGILMLACLSLLDIKSLIHNIAIKNILVIVGNGVAFVYFLVAGIADLRFAIFITLGAIPGGYFGSRLIRLINEDVVRRFTVILGVTASLILFVIKVVF